MAAALSVFQRLLILVCLFSCPQNVSHQVNAHSRQGISKGRLVHFSETNANNQTPSNNTPWIALVACDFNATNKSRENDILTLARSKGAVAALLYSAYSLACVINPEFAHVLNISATPIEYRFTRLGPLNESQYNAYDSHHLNDSFLIMNAKLQAGSPLAPGYLFSILEVYNSTAQICNLTENSTSAESPRKKKITYPGSIALYVIVGCILTLLCIIIISGVIRASRRPELYGSHACHHVGESYARGLVRATMDIFLFIGSRPPGPLSESKMTQAHLGGSDGGLVENLKESGIVETSGQDTTQLQSLTNRPTISEAPQTGNIRFSAPKSILLGATARRDGIADVAAPRGDFLGVSDDSNGENSDHHLEHESLENRLSRYRNFARQQFNAVEDVAQPEYGTVIGIDLGTSYSSVGVQKEGRFEIIANEQGHRMTPSWVSFSAHGDEMLVGESAKCAFPSNPRNTICGVKRLMGQKLNDTNDMMHWPFHVGEKNGKMVISVMYKGENHEFHPEEINARIISKMKETAEAYLGHKVTHAVITVPAYCNDAQRQATKDAGTMAGLTVLRMLNEPTAAALAYGHGQKGATTKIIVYSLGGGFFDVSLVFIENGVIGVLGTIGDNHLGGEDFDRRIVEHLVRTYRRKTGRDVSKDWEAMAKLKGVAEQTKKTLSMQQSASIEIGDFEGGNDFSATLTRGKFEELNLDLFKKTMELVGKVLTDGKVRRSEVDQIVLAGGSTRIPKVQSLLKEYFGKEPSKGLNPDQAAAYGAAVQGGVFSGMGGIERVVVIEVKPLTMGIEVVGGVFAPLIHRGTVIPTKKSQIFTTVYDHQLTVSIRVFEGEGRETKHNRLLGGFELSGLVTAAKGVPQIEVTFDIDANGILTVSAVDKETGSTDRIVIERLHSVV